MMLISIRPLAYLQMLLLALSVNGCADSSFKERSTTKSADGGAQDGLGKNGVTTEIPGSGVLTTNDEIINAFPPNAEVAKLKAACASAGDKMQTVSRLINYPERKNCSFATAPNLDRKNGFNQASETSPGKLDLPDGTVCDMSIKSAANAQLHYDDFLILTLGGQVLFASNLGLSKMLDQQQNIYNWDFSKIVGSKIANFEDIPYCLASGADCKLPGHDEMGPVVLNLTSKDIAPITLAIANKSSVSMDLVGTGDNDDQDCFHSALELTVDLKYLPR